MSGTRPLAHYPLAELKVLYRVLHAAVSDHPELMDSEFMDDLQRHLQAHAAAAGVDVSTHSQWAAWLADPGR